MRTRTLTIASFFSVAMAATLLGALVHDAGAAPADRPQARCRAVEDAPRGAHRGTVLSARHVPDIARANNAGVVNINTSKMVKLPRFRDPFHDFFGGDDDAGPLSASRPGQGSAAASAARRPASAPASSSTRTATSSPTAT